jgi:hypothetical protein
MTSSYCRHQDGVRVQALTEAYGGRDAVKLVKRHEQRGCESLILHAYGQKG